MKITPNLKVEIPEAADAANTPHYLDGGFTAFDSAITTNTTAIATANTAITTNTTAIANNTSAIAEHIASPVHTANLTHSRSGTTHLLTGVLPSTGIVTCTFKPTASFYEGDSFSINGSVYSAKPNGEETALPANAFVSGDIVSVNVDIVGKKLGFKLGGGGANDTLPSQITNFRGDGKNGAVQLYWSNPPSDFAGLYITRKAGSMPTKITDGTKLNCGTATSYLDSGLSNGTTYYYRAFPYNSKKQLQTCVPNGVANAKAGGIALSSLPLMSIVKIRENGTPQEFYVVRHNAYGTSRTQLLRRYVHSNRQWHTSLVNTYATSAIDAWLNNDYFNSLPSEAQWQITDVSIPYTPGNGDGTLSSLSRKVFLLSATELGQSWSGLNVEGTALANASTLKVATNSDGNGNAQWTRSPLWRETRYVVSLSAADGSLNSADSYNSMQNKIAPRPSFTLSGNICVDDNNNIVF